VDINIIPFTSDDEKLLDYLTSNDLHVN
jgi:hypothetical protein